MMPSLQEQSHTQSQSHLTVDIELQNTDQNNSSTSTVNDASSTVSDASSTDGGRCRSCLLQCNQFFSVKPTTLDEYSVTALDICVAVYSMIMIIVDIGSDIWVAVVHHQNGDVWWMALTITFIFTPSLIGFIFSVYVVVVWEESGWKAVDTIALFSIPGAQIIAYVRAIREAYKARKRQVAEEYVEAMHKSTYFALIEVFVQDSPQLILQLYIILKDPNTTVAPIQWASICISLLALSWGITSFYKARYMENRKSKISYPAVALCFVWYLFTVWPRVLALAISAIYLVYALIGILCSHFVVSFLFLAQVGEVALTLLNKFGSAFLWSFMNLICTHIPRQNTFIMDGDRKYTRLQFLFLHTLIYIENVCMLMLWYFSPVSHGAPVWFRYFACVSIIAGYLIGVFCQIVYYVELHPCNFQKEKEMHIAICMPWEDWIDTFSRRLRIENGVVRKWTEEIRRGRERARNEAEMREWEEEVKRQEQVFKGLSLNRRTEDEDWKEEISTEEGRIVRRWIDEIRRWGKGPRTEEEKGRHEEELQRQEKLMRGFRHCPRKEKTEWKIETSTEEGKIVIRWTEELRQWREGQKTEEENREHEEELQRQEKMMRGFEDCPEEEKAEWKKEISNEKGRIVRGWAEELRQWREGPKTEEENRRHEEELQEQIKLMRGSFHCQEEEKEDWEDEIYREKKRILSRWTEEIRQWREGEKTEDVIREQKLEIQRQEQLFREFYFFHEKENKIWKEEVSTAEGRIVRRWIEEIRGWGEGPRTEEENREHEVELQEQIKLMRGFFHCPEEEKEEWKEEIKTEEKRIVSRWTEEIRQWRDGEETEDVIREQKVEIQRQEQLFREFYCNHKKEEKMWKKEVSKWKKEMERREKVKK